MVLDHLLRERLGVRIRLLRERKLAGLGLEHVADRDLVHEVLRRWCAGRRRLGESNRSEEPASRDNQGFVHETLHWNVAGRRLAKLMSEHTGGSTACPGSRTGPIVRQPTNSKCNSHSQNPGRTMRICRLPDRRLTAARGT